MAQCKVSVAGLGDILGIELARMGLRCDAITARYDAEVCGFRFVFEKNDHAVSHIWDENKDTVRSVADAVKKAFEEKAK